jgi:hypothetical protein
MTGGSPVGVATVNPAVSIDELRVGGLLAEGGEGRVFELPLQPQLVFKSYRQPVPRAYLDDLVAWPAQIAPGLATRVRAAAAWPAATVVEGPDSAGSAVRHPDPAGRHRRAPGAGNAGTLPGGGGAGVLLPRAPRRFAVRHRDGTTRLASLSYLTADPSHRAVAYGLALPPPVSPQRLGLVYALARLLQAFEDAVPAVSHGDLSTKNVLWSLQRGPEVFVLDCDNCERFAADGRPVKEVARRRPMTPNWEDPAVAPGTNPSVESDRYSLALIFLRVVGAANFPIQARQREAPSVTVDFAVPPAQFGDALLGPGAPLWDLCERGLSLDPAGRPHPAAWVAALEAALDAFGAVDTMRSVWATQGGGEPAHPAPLPPRNGHNPVTIRPVKAAPRPMPRWTVVASSVREGPWRRVAPAGPVAASLATVAPGRPTSPAAGLAGSSWPPASPGTTSGGLGMMTPAPPVGRQALAYLAELVRWWLGLHRRTVVNLWSRQGRASGVRGVAVCLAVDAVGALIALFLVAMIVAPILSI